MFYQCGWTGAHSHTPIPILAGQVLGEKVASLSPAGDTCHCLGEQTVLYTERNIEKATNHFIMII